VIAAIVFVALLVSSTSAFAEMRPSNSTQSNMTTAKTFMASIYPSIVPSSLSSTLTSKAHELQQEALLAPRMTRLPILPSSSKSPELIVSVNVAKNPIVRGEPQVFHIAVFDPNSSNHIGNARISGIVFDPTKNSIQNKFNGTSNSNGTYSYSWTIPRTVKSQTYEVKVNASTVDPVVYSFKPGVTTFTVKGISSGNTNSHHHHHDVSNHDGRTHHGHDNIHASSRTHHGHGSGGGFSHHGSGGGFSHHAFG
jgi:uncharacterized membrane protein YgcG